MNLSPVFDDVCMKMSKIFRSIFASFVCTASFNNVTSEFILFDRKPIPVIVSEVVFSIYTPEIEILNEFLCNLPLTAWKQHDTHDLMKC